jgi:hypothetical protein
MIVNNKRVLKIGILIILFFVFQNMIYSQENNLSDYKDSSIIGYNKLTYPEGYIKLKKDIFIKSPYYSFSNNFGDSSDSLIIKLKFNSNCKIKEIEILSQTDTVFSRSIIHNFMVNSLWEKKQKNITYLSYETYLIIYTYKGQRENIDYNSPNFYFWDFYNSENNSNELHNIRVQELDSNNIILKNKPIETYNFPVESFVINHSSLKSDYIYFFSKYLAEISFPYFIN